jgi:hypothetical protein
MKLKDLYNLLALEVGFTAEFKRSGTSNLGREICAFANATGGVILLGVGDAGEIVGVEDHNRLKSEVQAIARTAGSKIEASEHWFTVIFPRPQSPDDEGNEIPAKHPASTPQVPRKYRTSTPQVRAMLFEAAAGDASRMQLQTAAGIRDREHFRQEYLKPLLDSGLLEMTIPDKPRSSKQRYRLTATGHAALEAWEQQR